MVSYPNVNGVASVTITQSVIVLLIARTKQINLNDVLSLFEKNVAMMKILQNSPIEPS